jgi:hypothetical protein
MQQYTAANFALAWGCRIEPSTDPSLWAAWRSGDRPVAAVWIDETALEFERARVNARAATSHWPSPSMVVIMPVSASRALWSAGDGIRELAMPITPRRRREPHFYCETCRGRHPLRLMKACREGVLAR